MAEDDSKITTEDEPQLKQASDEVDSDDAKLSDKTETKPSKPESKDKIGMLWQKYLAHKKLTIPATILILLAVLLTIPFTRYTILGLFIKQDFSVSVTDSITHKPVSSVTIQLAGATASTNSSGSATVKVKVGKSSLTAQKKYYNNFSSSVTVPVSKSKTPYQISMTATGRQVPVTVTNKITGKGLGGATIKTSDTEAQTDKDGNTTMVLPADKDKVSVTITAQGYNQTTATVTVTDQKIAANSFSITPTGKVYFLSKASGKIDVVKTNLDGSDRQTVLAGTGKEEDTGTVLLASRDWKYLALLARRDSDKAKLYLIDTASDKLTTMDEGDATFELIGWQDNNFAYLVYRNNIPNWQPKAASIKSFNAQTAKLTTLDSTNAEGIDNASAKYETFITANTHILGTMLVYTKTWYIYPGYINVTGKQNTLSSINLDGSNKKVISSLDAAQSYFGSVVQYEPQELLVQVSSPNAPESFYTLSSSGDYTKSSNQINGLGNTYPTYLFSPSGKQTFWSEERDGKNTLFIGNQNGEDSKQIASLSEYLQYGWFTDDYLLVSKNASELYIMPKDGSQTPLKISDYHKPAQSYYGYGGGYGGF